MRRGEERREDTCGEELEDPAVGRGQGEGGPGQGEGGCQKPDFPIIAHIIRFFEKTRCENFTTYY